MHGLPSERPPTVPRMGGFKRALFGYHRGSVETVLAGREARIESLERDIGEVLEGLRTADDETIRAERECTDLSEMVLEREREIRSLNDRLREADERYERSVAALEPVARRLEEIQTQARGQATRIRMKALREAVEVSRRAQELADANSTASRAGDAAHVNGGPPAGPPEGVYEGQVRLEIGPLGDFSQLVGIEEAISRMGAAEISVERFSEGRATLSMRLDEPVELLRELEESAPLEFKVRRPGGEGLILDVDEDAGPEQHAA